MRAALGVALAALAIAVVPSCTRAQHARMPLVSVGVSSLLSTAGKLPAYALGGEVTVRLATIGVSRLQIAAVAFAPLSYTSDAICVEAGGGRESCSDGSQHASQLGIITIDLISHNRGRWYGVMGAGAYAANESRKTHPPPGVSPRAGSYTASAGIGRRHTVGRQPGHVDARLRRFQSVFGEHQWGLSLTVALSFP